MFTSSISVPQAWKGKTLILSPDGRQVPVENEIPPHYCVGFSKGSGQYTYRETRNRILVEDKTQQVFKRYAALEDLVDYSAYGFSKVGHIWFNPNDRSQADEAERIKDLVASEIIKAKGSCTIL